MGERWARAGGGRELVALTGLLAVALGLWLLAYQAPLAHTLYVGGDLALQRREDDAPFLRGANGSEPPERVITPDAPRGYLWWWEYLARSGGRPYRWMRPTAAVLMPGAGGGRHLVTLSAGGSPATTTTIWETGPGLEYHLSLPPGEPRRYHLLAVADQTGDLHISMRSSPFIAPDDPRELSFVLYQVQLRSVDGLPRAPAWPTLAWLTLAMALSYALARVSGAGRPGALALGAGAALAAGYALALHRPALTSFAPTLGLLSLSCAALAGLAWPLTRRFTGAAARPVLGLVLLAFALRMGGMLHPQALFSDLGLHANNLFKITLGEVFFTTGLPDDAGGGQQPYPPGAYLLLLPGQLLAPDAASRRLLVQGGVALLDSLTLGAIWLLIRRAGFGMRASLLGAACYLLPTPALESFSIGEYANLGGQALALPLLLLLGLGLAGARRTASEAPGGRGWPALLLAVAVALGLLGHSGVTLSVGALVAAAWGLSWAARLRGRNPAIDPLRLTIASAAALATTLLIFYSAPIFVATLSGRAGSGAGSAPLRVLSDTLAALIGAAPPQGTRVALPPLIGAVALGGLALVAARGGAPAAPLGALLAAWWTGTALTLGLLVVAGQGVRWAIFLYPALCLTAGPLLAALWRRGRAARLVAATTLAVIIVTGLGAWIVQIRDYIHT